MIYGSRSESVFLVSGFCQKLYSLCWSQWIEIKTFLFIPVLESLYFGSLFDKLWDKIILNQSKSWHHVKSETNMFILNMKKMKNDSMLHIADSHFSDFRNLFIFTFFSTNYCWWWWYRIPLPSQISSTCYLQYWHWWCSLFHSFDKN